MLVVLESIDGGGKETQINLLKKELGSWAAFKYPTDKFQMLNDYLHKKIEIDYQALFLLFLADIKDEQEKIKHAVKSCEYVFVDRYVFSTIAYEINKIKYENAKKIIEDISFIKPDKVILLDLDAKTSQARKQKQKQQIAQELDRYEENIAYLEKVRNNFNKLYKDRFLTKKWYKIDATKSIEQVNKEILKVLKK